MNDYEWEWDDDRIEDEDESDSGYSAYSDDMIELAEEMIGYVSSYFVEKWRMLERLDELKIHLRERMRICICCGQMWDEADCLDYKHAVGARLCPECHENTEEIRPGDPLLTGRSGRSGSAGRSGIRI